MIAEKTFSLIKFLTPIRMRYPWFIGGALWLGWLLSIAAGTFGGNNTDRFGQLIGTDFVAFYTAGEIVRTGQSSRLYDPALAVEIQTRLYGFEPQNFNPYLNPPFYAWLFVPFSTLPYPASPILWMALSLLFLFLAIKILGINKPFVVFLLSLTWLPAWSAISFGQNSFMSLLIFAGAYYFWRKEKYFVAGLITGLLLYKPQLLIGVMLIWVFDWKHNWKSLAGVFVTGLVLSAASYLWMPEATLAYLTYVQRISAGLMTHPAFPIWNAHGMYTFWHAIFPAWPDLSMLCYILTAAFGLAVFLKFYFATRPTPPVLYSGALLLTVWITPYLMVYDWAILLLPAILLWQAGQEHQSNLKVVFSILWVVMLISGPLTYLQWHWLGWALQISLPALGFVIFLVLSLLPGKNRKVPLPGEAN